MMLGPVCGHEANHLVQKGLAMLGGFEIYEIDDDDAAHVPQPKLSCNLFGGVHIGLQGMFLLVVVFLGTISAIDIDDMQSFGMFNDQINATGHADRCAKGALDLFVQASMLKERHLAFVILNQVDLVGGNTLNIFAELFGHAWMVHQNLIKLIA